MRERQDAPGGPMRAIQTFRKSSTHIYMRAVCTEKTWEWWTKKRREISRLTGGHLYYFKLALILESRSEETFFLHFLKSNSRTCGLLWKLRLPVEVEPGIPPRPSEGTVRRPWSRGPGPPGTWGWRTAAASTAARSARRHVTTPADLQMSSTQCKIFFKSTVHM